MKKINELIVLYELDESGKFVSSSLKKIKG